MEELDEPQDPYTKILKFLNRGTPDPPSSNTYYSNCGFLLLIIVIIIYFFWDKLKTSVLTNLVQNNNPNEILSRQEALEASRIALQMRHNNIIARYKEEQMKKEIDPMQKNNPKNSSIVNEPKLQDTSAKKKTRLRSDDYNPLVGDTKTCCYRPSARFGAGGG